MDRYTGDSKHYRGILAGLSAGTAAVLGCFLLIAGVWHRVSAQVGTAVTVIVWTFTSLVLAAAAFAVAYLGLRLHRHVIHPETLTRQTVRAEVIQASPESPAIPAAAPLAALPPVTHNWHLNDPETAAAVIRAVADTSTEGN